MSKNISAKNSNLSAAKKAKNDEFYTQYHDIEKEMNAYLDFDENVFRDKVILLPCDDPEWSNFTKYFAQNFKRLGLKKLISTSYAHHSKQLDTAYQPSLFEAQSSNFDKVKAPKQGKIFTLTEDSNHDGVIDLKDIKWEYLQGDGDFRSDEIKILRDEVDIIITNPPFSLFREFMAWIMDGKKQFAVIGNMNAITYKEIFPLIKDNRIWLGATGFNQGMYFRVPDNFVYASSYKFEREQNGQKVNRVPAVCWYSNIEHGRRHQPLDLMTMADNLKFNKQIMNDPNAYQKYDNYDAIEIPKTNGIPSNYNGVMGVPISFLDKYCPEQFDILGATQRGCHNEVPDTKKYDDYWEMKQNGERTGSSGGKTNENTNLATNDGKKNYFINKDGHIVQSTYQRIFIKHKNNPRAVKK